MLWEGEGQTTLFRCLVSRHFEVAGRQLMLMRSDSVRETGCRRVRKASYVIPFVLEGYSDWPHDSVAALQGTTRWNYCLCEAAGTGKLHYRAVMPPIVETPAFQLRPGRCQNSLVPSLLSSEIIIETLRFGPQPYFNSVSPPTPSLPK